MTQSADDRPRLVTSRQLFDFRMLEWMGVNAGESMLQEAYKQRVQIMAEIKRACPNHEPDPARFILEIGVQYLTPPNEDADQA